MAKSAAPDPIRAYLERFREYEAEHKAAMQTISIVKDVSAALESKLDELLVLTFGFEVPLRRRDQFPGSRKIDMSKWPTEDAIRTALDNWVASYRRLLDAWHVVPLKERSGLKEPPSFLTAR